MGRLLTDVFAVGPNGSMDDEDGFGEGLLGFSPSKLANAGRPNRAGPSRMCLSNSSITVAYAPNHARRSSGVGHGHRGSRSGGRDAALAASSALLCEEYDMLPYQRYLVEAGAEPSSEEDEETAEDDIARNVRNVRGMRSRTRAHLGAHLGARMGTHMGTHMGRHRSASHATLPPEIYRCPDCHTDICHSESVISTDFWGAHGSAYLVSRVINVQMDPLDTKQMRTGIYGVKNIHCAQCHRTLGWMYCCSQYACEQYKVGKYVIEKAIMAHFPL